MMYLFYIFMTLIATQSHGFFSYDRAASLMEQGRWDEAKNALQQLLVDQPDSPQILYDTGVASYHLKDYTHAFAYFNRVTELPQTTINLKEQAHFNAGNCAAALKDYKKALEQYQAVLAINKSNEMARHNIEQIKKMMQQEEQQKKNKDEQDKKENNDQQQNKEQSDKPQEKPEKDSNKNGNQEKQKQDEMNQGSGDHSEQKQDKQDKQDSSSENQKRDREQSEPENAQGTQEQEQKNHKQSTEKNNEKRQKQANHSQEKDQAEQKDQASYNQMHDSPAKEKLDPQLARILEMQEKKDAQTNKKMINAIVGEAMGGAQGENCW